MHWTSRTWFPFLLAVILLSFQSAGADDLELITRANPVSDTPQSDSGQLTHHSQSISGDECYIVYSTLGPNISPGQIDAPPRTRDVFVWDRSSGTATLVSHAVGNPVRTSNGSSYALRISDDGQFVLFFSDATDLIVGQVDAPGTFDVFLWERSTGLVRLISHAFDSTVTAGDLSTTFAALSADGRYVALMSEASNFLPGTGGVATPAVYFWDRISGARTLISHRAGLPANPAAGSFESLRMSGDGGLVAFESSATDLVAGQVDDGAGPDIFLWTRLTGQNLLVSRAAGTATTSAGGESFFPNLSRDGRYLAYSSTSVALIPGGDGNALLDLYLFDRVAGTNVLVSHANGLPTSGGSGHSWLPQITADGSWVSFHSRANNLVPGQIESSPDEWDVFLWSRALNQTTLVSHRNGSATTTAVSGAQGGSISDDGRFVTFGSRDPDLVAGQNESFAGSYDVFLFDRVSGVVSLVDHRPGEPAVPGNNDAFGALMSRSGSFAIFTTRATDLVAGGQDWNLATDLFLYDRATTGIRLISGHAPGEASSTQSIASDDFPSRSRLSADGRWVAVESPAPNLAGGAQFGGASNVFLVDRSTGSQTLISRSAIVPSWFAPGRSFSPSISADGRFVAYLSEAGDLVAGQVDPLFSSIDVFLFDREANASLLVSHQAGQPTTAVPGPHSARDPRISTDGRFVAYYFSGALIDGQPGPAFFLYDRSNGTNTLVSRLPGQAQASAAGTSDDPPALSADGRYVAYTSRSNELVTGITDDTSSPDVFLFDRTTGENRLLTRRATSSGQAAGGAAEPAISADGRYVSYTSSSPDLAPGQIGSDGANSNDVFLWDRETDTTLLVSRISAGTPGNGASNRPAISADGRYVAFLSRATDLVANQVDPADTPDAFLFDRESGEVVLASHAHGLPAQAIGATELAGLPALSADGGRLAFATESAAVIAGQTKPGGLFIYDRVSGTNQLASHRPGDAANPGNAPGFAASFSADGSVLSFSSAADDLVARDYNWATEVFVHRTSTAAATGVYFTVPPCRLLDTRADGQTPALASAAIRALTASGRCGVPSSAKAIAVTLTVTGGTGGGHLSLFPGNLMVPATAALNFAAGQTRSSNAIASLATNGAGTLGLSAFVAGNGTVEAIVDVFGYFE